jgi:glycosyltransferase involved in cell wall biosynthesis
MTISFCLIVWNELQGCQADVPRLPVDAFDEVYAVDGGSSDGTVEFLHSCGINVYRQPQKGLNAAYLHAVDRSHCDAVVTFFPKGTTPPESVLNFRPLFDAGYQIVIASRNMKGGRNEEDDQLFRPRKWLVICLSWLIALLWRREGHRIGDVLHGYKGFTVQAFRLMNPSSSGGLTIDLELAVRSYRLRLQRTEFPTHETKRSYSQTHFKIWPTGKRLARFLWTELWR